MKNFTGEVGWEDLDALVVLDLAKKKLRIYTKIEQDFDFVNYSKEEEKTNGDYKTSFTAVDKDGTKCLVTLLTYAKPKNIHVATLTVEYGEYLFSYRLKGN